jgi:hypothetical protein
MRPGIVNAGRRVLQVLPLDLHTIPRPIRLVDTPNRGYFDSASNTAFTLIWPLVTVIFFSQGL